MHLAATEIFTLFAGIAWNPGLRGRCPSSWGSWC